MTLVAFASDVIAVRPWNDESLERVGFDPRSPYVERFWLGVVGPSTTWLLRRIAADGCCTDIDVDVAAGRTGEAVALFQSCATERGRRGHSRIACPERRSASGIRLTGATYGDPPSDDREWWPGDLSGRSDLCMCGAIPNAAAQHPDFAGLVDELREFMESREGRR